MLQSKIHLPREIYVINVKTGNTFHTVQRTHRGGLICVCVSATYFQTGSSLGMGTMVSLVWPKTQNRLKARSKVIISLEKSRLKGGFSTCEGLQWERHLAVIPHLRSSPSKVKGEWFWSQKAWVYCHLLPPNSATFQSWDLGHLIQLLSASVFAFLRWSGFLTSQSSWEDSRRWCVCKERGVLINMSEILGQSTLP